MKIYKAKKAEEEAQAKAIAAVKPEPVVKTAAKKRPASKSANKEEKSVAPPAPAEAKKTPAKKTPAKKAAAEKPAPEPKAKKTPAKKIPKATTAKVAAPAPGVESAPAAAVEETAKEPSVVIVEHPET